MRRYGQHEHDVEAPSNHALQTFQIHHLILGRQVNISPGMHWPMARRLRDHRIAVPKSLASVSKIG